VVLAGRNRERLYALSDELDMTVSTLDATRCDEVEARAREALESFGRLDGIANCVGSLLLKPAHITKEEEWNETLLTNLGSAFAAVRAAAKVMRSTGSVVLVSSAAARMGLPNHEAIAAAKAGVVGLMRSAAATYASRGIRVNAVAPGLVRTPMTQRITSSKAAESASVALHPLGRLGEPEDVARVLAWLLGPESGWITGQVLGVDGGLAALKTPPPRAGAPV
jgi:NAD(P)-dependent dehydrogenase (short-subunit alcohol dehydrogenase family)